MSYVECIVLGLLNQGYRYGHELDKVIEERSMRLWSKITRVAMYQALKRINEKGWVEVSTEKEEKLPERVVYTITEAGRKALEHMIEEGLASNELTEFRICIPVSFLYILPPQKAIEQLEKRKAVLHQLLTKRMLTIENDEKNGNYFGKKANVKLIHGYYQMEWEWIEWMISELKENMASEIK